MGNIIESRKNKELSISRVFLLIRGRQKLKHKFSIYAKKYKIYSINVIIYMNIII